MTTKSHPEASGPGLTQASEKNNQPAYELGFHVSPVVAEDGVGAVVDKVRAVLTVGTGSEILAEQAPTKMTLAYTIELSNQGKHEKFNESYFGFIKFGSDREHVKAIEEKLRAMKEIIRFLLIEVDRAEPVTPVRRAVFASPRLEGETIKKPELEVVEEKVVVSEEELDKSIDALVAE
ncbi:MAG: 30S ribosomal protein S6 [bacterium]